MHSLNRRLRIFLALFAFAYMMKVMATFVLNRLDEYDGEEVFDG